MPKLKYYKSLLLFAIVCLAACSNAKQEKNDHIYNKVIIGGFERSIKYIDENINSVFKAIDLKFNDRDAYELAKKWLPKAERVKVLSDDMYSSIDLVKGMLLDTTNVRSCEDVMIKLGNSRMIYSKLQAYRNDLLNIDSTIEEEFKLFDLTPIEQFKYSNNEAGFTEALFANKTSLKAVVILSEIQSYIRSAEFDLLRFCLQKTSDIGGCGFGRDMTQIISMQSVTHARPGEHIEITAGFAVYLRSSDFTITIDGKKAKQEFDGMGISTIKASKKSGKHIVPIEVEWNDWRTGNKKMWRKEVIYYVDSTSSNQ